MEKKIQKSYEIDMCNGPLLGKIMLFTLPLMLSGILQLLFNAADVVVVGRFAGNEALAAVGSSYTLMVFVTSVILGLCMSPHQSAGKPVYWDVRGGKCTGGKILRGKAGGGGKPHRSHFYVGKRGRRDNPCGSWNRAGKASPASHGYAG